MLRARHPVPEGRFFRYCRSDFASAIEAGHDVRTALLAFGIDASHGYERIHTHALTSVARLTALYAASPLEIARDLEEVSGLNGFPRQPTGEADQQQFDPDNVLASADKSPTLLPGKDIRKNKDLTLRVERRARWKIALSGLLHTKTCCEELESGSIVLSPSTLHG